MNISRVIEIRMFDHQGLPVAHHHLDASNDFMSKRWPKVVYTILRQAVSVCLTGGIVVMRGTLEPK